MPCETFPVPGGFAFACGRGRSRRCSSCKTRTASKLCDFPVTRDGKQGTCDRALCTRCAVPVGPNRDLCPPHARHQAKQDELPGIGLARMDEEAMR